MTLQNFAVETEQSEGEITFQANALHSSGCNIEFVMPFPDKVYICATKVAKIDLVTHSDGRISAWLIDKLDCLLPSGKTIWANPEMLRKEARR